MGISTAKKRVGDLSLDKHMLKEFIKKALKLSFKKHLALWLQNQFRLSIGRAFANVRLSPTKFYYERVDKSDDLMRMRLCEIALTGVRYSFWRLFVSLPREGFTDNHKPVNRVTRKNG
jgi:putative transposase